MTDTDIAAAVADFMDGRWAALSDVFVLASRVSALRTERSDAIETAAAMLRQARVRLEIWDGEQLSHRLREIPEIVESFFGPYATRRFCSSALTARLQEETVVTDQMLRDRLPQLPPTMEARLISAFRDDPRLVWRLVTALTSIDAAPSAVIEQWQRRRPSWLDAASWQVQVAAAELAAGYGGARLAVELMMAAAAQGATRRDYWLARAASYLYELNDETGWRAALTVLGPVDGVTEPYARAMIIWLEGDPAAAESVLGQWTPADPIDRNVRASLRFRLAFAPTADSTMTRESLDRALSLLRDALRDQWTPGLALIRGRLLIVRHSRGESQQGAADLREARASAIRARDNRRTYRGDSVEAAALACQAAAMAMDFTAAIQIGTAGPNGATPAEAGGAAVCEWVAVAALTLNDFELAEDRIARVTEPFAQARLEALLAEARGLDQKPFVLRALDVATEDQQLAQALHELARAGAEQLPRLEELRAGHPDAADEIEAVAKLGRGHVEEAIRLLRPRRRESPTAALTLVRAYREAGDVDSCVNTLRDAATDFGDPDLRQSAAEILAGAGRKREAEEELESLLASTDPDWRARPDALRLAAQLAYDDGRLDAATAKLQTVLVIQPYDTRSRWALVRLLMQRADVASARRMLAEAAEPMEPTNVDEAQLWIELRGGQIPVEQWVSGCLRLLRQFGAADERFSAYTITSLIGPRASIEPLPDSLLAEFHQEFEGFFQRWPDSRYLRRLSAEDIPQLVEQMTEMVRTSQEERVRRRRLSRAVMFSRVPVALLAAAVRRSVAEVALRRGVGVLQARHPDPGEIAECIDGVRFGVGNDVVIDTTSITTMVTITPELRKSVLGTFSRVITSDETLRDAHIAHDALSPRSTDSWTYDEQSETGRPQEIPQSEADRLADQAATVLAFTESLARYPRPTLRAADTLDKLSLVNAASIVDLAKQRKTALWADDPFVRVVARMAGVPAFSTTAVLDHLAQQQLIAPEQHEAAVRTLIKERIGDMPFDERRLLELAEDEAWSAGSVAAVLGRPNTWTDTPRRLRLFGRIIGLARAHNPGAVPAWLYHAVQGAAASTSSPNGGSTIAARLLTIGLLESHAQGQAAANLVAATRQALVDTADPDEPSTPDPLAECAALFRQIVGRALSYDLATRFVIATFAMLPQADRDNVVRTLLQ